MGTFAGIIAVVLLLAWLMLAGAGCSRNASEEPPAIAPPPVVLTEKMKSLDREAVRAMLKRLADTPPPKTEVVSACCYEPTILPDRVEYLCPKCGERTLYARHARESMNNSAVFLIEEELPRCRREFQKLRNIAHDAIELDESQFCRKCSPNITSPRIVLHITYNNGKTRDVEIITSTDLRLLQDFLAGSIIHHGFYNENKPLQESMPRLQQLLGIELEK